jgi:hypothetical protein
VGADIAFYVQHPEYLSATPGEPRLSNRMRERLASVGGTLGAFVTGYGVYRLVAKTSNRSVSRWWAIPTGLVGGLVGGLFGVGGPIYAAYLTARMPDHARMRATLSAVFSYSTGFRLLVFLLSGLMLQKEVWWGVLLLVPSMLIGLTIGHRLHAKLSREQVGGFISVLLIASGLSLLWRAF